MILGEKRSTRLRIFKGERENLEILERDKAGMKKQNKHKFKYIKVTDRHNSLVKKLIRTSEIFWRLIFLGKKITDR